MCFIIMQWQSSNRQRFDLKTKRDVKVIVFASLSLLTFILTRKKSFRDAGVKGVRVLIEFEVCAFILWWQCTLCGGFCILQQFCRLRCWVTWSFSAKIFTFAVSNPRSVYARINNSASVFMFSRRTSGIGLSFSDDDRNSFTVRVVVWSE